MLAGILIPITFFAMIFGVVYVVVTARNRERLNLIEKGADPKLFESLKKPSNGGTLKWGLLLVGIGLGVFLASILVTGAGFEEGAAYPSMICLFGGLGLIISHRIETKASSQKNIE